MSRGDHTRSRHLPSSRRRRVGKNVVGCHHRAPATIHSQIYSESANIVIISLSALRRHQLGPLVLASLRSAKNRRRCERKSIIAFGTCCRRPVNQCVARRRRYKSGIGGRRLYVTTSNRRHWLPTVADSLSRCEKCRRDDCDVMLSWASVIREAAAAAHTGMLGRRQLTHRRIDACLSEGHRLPLTWRSLSVSI